MMIGAFFFGGILLFLGGVPLIAPCWHAAHGGDVTCSGWIIHIPDGFCPWGDARIWKLSLGSPFFRVPYGHISLFERGKVIDLSRDFPLFESVMVQQGTQSGVHLDSRRMIVVDGREGRCIQMSGSAPTRTEVRCIIDGDPIAVFYEGHPKYLPEFYSMFQRMRKNEDKKGNGLN